MLPTALLHLLLDGVTALLRDVDEVKHAALEVGQGRNGLHLDGVALLQGVVQDTGGVHHLGMPRVARVTGFSCNRCRVTIFVQRFFVERFFVKRFS